MMTLYGTRRVDGTRSGNYVCYRHKASLKMCEIKAHEKCPLPSVPAELVEWQVFYVELMSLGTHASCIQRNALPIPPPVNRPP